MTVTVEKPRIITLVYKQEQTDDDYGSCLWARFNLDLKNYTMSIESDCGNYSHGWVPTPGRESFLQLCARFNWEYMLGKISALTVIDGEATFQKVKELMEQLDDDVFASINEEAMEEIESACYGHREDTEAYIAICDILGEHGFNEYDSYEVACCIEKDYPAGAKKLAEIYRDRIQPVIRKMAKEDKPNEG